MLRLLWEHWTSLEALIAQLDQKTAELTRLFLIWIEQADEVPGIDRYVAEVLLAEVFPDMKPFPTPQHLASWSRMCPGNDESAGKRRSGRTIHRNRWLKRALVEAAWAASHTKETYLAAQYRHLAGRRGTSHILSG